MAIGRHTNTRPRLPDRAIVSYPSSTPQHDIANCSGLSVWRWGKGPSSSNAPKGKAGDSLSVSGLSEEILQ